MRVPKFRAWLKPEQQMVDVYEMTFINDGITILSYDMDFYTDDEFKLMQFTGLKDVHGKEIYEGDIINYKYGRHTSTQFVVKYDEFQATFVVVDNHNDLVYTFRELADYIQLNSLEVIGNIYENPDLLGE
jgi:uncharacterized phage protein (TIGR01671 family)